MSASSAFRVRQHAAFDPQRMTKVDLARGDGLFLGLNCFEAGQSQAVHDHRGADKFYLIVSGKARIVVADTEILADEGMLVWAPAGVPHGVAEALERTIMLIGLAPPPNRPAP